MEPEALARISLTDVLLADSKPQSDKFNYYVLPYSRRDFTSLKGSSADALAPQREELQQAKGRMMLSLYQHTAATVLMFVNTDALRRMQRAQNILQNTFNSCYKYTAISDGREIEDYELQAKARDEAMINIGSKLLGETTAIVKDIRHYPLSVDESKEIADRVAQYNTFLNEKIRGKEGAGLFLHIAGRDRGFLEVIYGTAFNGQEFNTWPALEQLLQVGGSGMNQFIRGGPSMERQYEMIHFKTRTGSQTTVNLDAHPGTAEGKEICGETLAMHLMPAQMIFSTNDSRSGPETTVLRMIDERLRQLEHEAVTVQGRPATLLYLPQEKRTLIEYIEPKRIA